MYTCYLIGIMWWQHFGSVCKLKRSCWTDRTWFGKSHTCLHTVSQLMMHFTACRAQRQDYGGGTERSGLHNSYIFGKSRKTKSWLSSKAEHRGKKGLGSRGDQEPDGQSIQTSDEGKHPEGGPTWKTLLDVLACTLFDIFIALRSKQLLWWL